jgi:glucose-6-phosphate 1-epimerase
MHGFARDIAWDLVTAGNSNDGAALAQFLLRDSADTRKLWPHAFTCELTVTASGPTLAIELAVTNTGDAAFAFTTALHTYLRVDDVHRTRVRGLTGVHYRDKMLREDDVRESAPELVVDRPLDRVYRATPAALEVREPHRSLGVRAIGTTDTVIWNPGPSPNAAPGDLEPDAYRSFLCVEAAVASTTITLSPQETWRGGQTLTSR